METSEVSEKSPADSLVVLLAYAGWLLALFGVWADLLATPRKMEFSGLSVMSMVAAIVVYAALSAFRRKSDIYAWIYAFLAVLYLMPAMIIAYVFFGTSVTS